MTDINGNAITIIDTQDEHGGTIREITAVDLSEDTVTAPSLRAGVTAHDARGRPIVGTAINTYINGSTSSMGAIIGTLTPIGATIDGTLTIPDRINVPSYTGDYEFTPSAETQTIYTSGYYLQRNVTINPIPNNYGLITWNGSTLTIS